MRCTNVKCGRKETGFSKETQFQEFVADFGDEFLR